jgi:neutral trehalase
MAMYDDLQQTHFEGLIGFITDADRDTTWSSPAYWAELELVARESLRLI